MAKPKETGLSLVGGSAVTRRGRDKLNTLADAMLDCLFDADGIPFSTVISGGEGQGRTAALLRILGRCVRGALPTIILHAGNQMLGGRLARGMCCAYLPVSKTFCAFDLLGSLKPELIADILYDTAQRVSNVGTPLFMAIRLGCELIHQAGETCSLANLCTFPWGDMGAYIRDHQDRLNALEAMNKLGSIGSGAWEAELFFSRLQKEPLPITSGKARVLSLKELMQEGGCVCLDIRSDSNRYLTELVLSILDFLRGRAFRFLTVVDSFPVHPNSRLPNLLANRDRRTPTIYLSPDCTAVHGLEEQTRHSILGSPVNLILFSHMNGNSAELLSQFFSEHDDVTVTSTSGTSRESLALINKTVSSSRAAAETRRRNIMPEDIRSLRQGVALVFPAGAPQAYMPISFTE